MLWSANRTRARSRTVTSPADLADAANLIALSHEAELVFAPDLSIVACSESYGQVLGVSCGSLTGLAAREAFREGPALDLLTSSLETVLTSKRPHWIVAEAPASILDGRAERPSPRMIVNMPVLDSGGRVVWILHCLGEEKQTGRSWST
jgi:hypothetical protein